MPDWKTLSADRRVQIAALVVVVGLAAVLGWFALHGSETPAPETATAPAPSPPPTAAGSTPSEPGATPAPPVAAAAGAPAPPPVPPKDTARIVFTTVPSTNATVSWGKTRLGVISPQQSLVIVRPRDSGPLDVMVRAPGYLPVQTRAHTFADTRIVVRLTKPDQTQTLVGYRAPIDAGVDGGSAFPSESFTSPPSPFP